jgi:vacuolar protein sorting-associated protein 13A/C
VIKNPSFIQLSIPNSEAPDTISIAAGGNEVTFLQPGERVAFVWDHWIDDNDHILEVEIEGIRKDYHIDKI